MIDLEEEDWVSSHVYLQDINIMKKEENEVNVQVQDESSRRYHELEAWNLYGDHGYMKACRRRISLIVDYRGAIRKT
jgi:hypothetical protein